MESQIIELCKKNNNLGVALLRVLLEACELPTHEVLHVIEKFDKKKNKLSPKEKEHVEVIDDGLSVYMKKIEKIVEYTLNKYDHDEKPSNEVIEGVLKNDPYIQHHITTIAPMASIQLNTSYVQHINKKKDDEISSKVITLQDKYVIHEYIAEGGQGKVYKAENRHSGTEVAIKLLPQALTKDKSILMQYQQEFNRIVQKLTYDHIVQYRDFDYAKEREQYFIVMDYVRGKTLRDLMLESYDKPFNLKSICNLLIPVGKALEHAHTNDVIHCDIKPENILISEEGKVFLTDFGLSQELYKETDNAKEYVPQGTLPYMAPEQFNSSGVKKETDLWAMGVIIYEMYTGELPFKGYEKDLFNHYKEIICTRSPDPIDNEDMQKIFDAIFMKNYNERPTSINKILESIYRLAEQEELYEEALEDYDQQNEKQSLKKLTELMHQGYHKATIALGKIYETDSTLSNRKNAIKYYTLAKNESRNSKVRAEASRYLGILYSTNNRQEASIHFRKAETWGDSKSMFYLGKGCYTGLLYSKKDFKKALYHFRNAAQKEHVEAMYAVGYLLSNDHKGVRKDVLQAIKWYEKASKNNHRLAAYQLGLLYHIGDDEVKKDYVLAQKWYKKAALRNCERALGMLGDLYYEGGYGLENNNRSALECYKEAAEKGHLSSLVSFHFLKEQYPEYEIELNQEKCLEMGMEKNSHIKKEDIILYLTEDWKKEILESDTNQQGDIKKYVLNVTKRYTLQLLATEEKVDTKYNEVMGIKLNEQELEAYLKLKIEKNDVPGIIFFTSYYEEKVRRGEEVNYEQVKQVYLKGIEQEETFFVEKLGDLYYNGLLDEGINYEEAKKWYTEAAVRGDEVAKKKLEKKVFIQDYGVKLMIIFLE